MPQRPPARFYVEAETGPVMRTALDVLDFGAGLLVSLPETHEAEKRELLSRMQTLQQTCMATLWGKARARK